ncbi:uncharacterized protein LOC143462144 [Clavelina lepadiformis]|uniref:uncharacterized protein LOC143462144 n=1 Tax=Clavelina lepadiformis TaxID=159417 RepID=UPI0040411268
MTFKLLLLLVYFILEFSLARSSGSADICSAVTVTDLRDACSLRDHVNELPACDELKNKAWTEDSCLQNNNCCWDEEKNFCFKKPVKCYVDLRLEKCFATARHSTSAIGIYTGYSPNGSHCHINSLVIDGAAKELFRYKTDVGFPITFDNCSKWWNVKVIKREDGTCSVFKVSDDGVEHNLEPQGKMYFNKSCIIKKNNYLYEFPYSGPHTARKCACKVDAWLQADDEDLPVANRVKNYIKEKEHHSTCTQVLGVIVRASWKEKVSVLNHNEANVMLDALDNLTHHEDRHNISLFDAGVFIESTQKIADYPFYEGIEKKSAKQIIKKTTSVVSNIIQTVSRESEVDQDYVIAASRSTTVGLETTKPRYVEHEEYKNIKQKEFELKQDLFRTLESMSTTVALHVKPSSNETDVLIEEVNSNVDLQLVVTNSKNIESVFDKTHITSSAFFNNDQVSVIGFPHQKTNSNADSVAVLSVFYKYPTPEYGVLPRRISNYVSVNARKFIEGRPVSLSVPVNFTLHSTASNVSNDVTKYCAYLVSNISEELWDEFGCQTFNSDNGTSCSCNHTTHFAVLMKTSGTELPPEHDKALEIISMILGSVSIACLCVTVLVFIHYRRTLLKDRMLLHFHLIIALLGGYISLLTSSIFTSPDAEVASVSCIAFAVVTHFFFLSVFFWALVEGLYLFYKIVMVFERKWAEFLPTYAPIVGWFVPFSIVTTTFVLTRYSFPFGPENATEDAYASPSSCFLRYDSSVIWTYVGPVLGIIGINLLILIKVMYVIFKSSCTSSRLASADKSTRVNESLKRASRGALILLPILGVPAVVGILYSFYNENQTGEVLPNVGIAVGTMGAYLQVIFVGIQGICIFLFYCVWNAEVRGAYELAARRRRSAGSLGSSFSQRKRSRVPLLFSRSNSVAEVAQPERTCQRSYSSASNTRRFTNSSTVVGRSYSQRPTYGRSVSHEGHASSSRTSVL